LNGRTLTAAKFKPLEFPMSGFALSNIANICILMILNDFCLLLFPEWGKDLSFIHGAQI
jgi:hypothetical protein